MTILGWIIVVVLLLASAGAAFLGWAICVVAKQTDEWMEHWLDEWEVGG